MAPTGRPMEYLERGRGEPAVVLLHALPLRGAMWEPQVEDLSARHRVVVPDLIGFGRSEVPETPEAYSVDAWADDVAGLVEELDLAPVVVVGLSMGGYVAFAMVRRHRERLRALVLADTRADADSPDVAAKRTEHQARLAAGDSEALVEETIEALLAPSSGHRDEVVRRARELMGTTSPQGWIGALEALKRRADSTPLLATVDLPTLVLVGEHDRTSPPAVAERMGAAIPGARLAVVPDAGHLSSMENPAAFNGVLSEFLVRQAL